MVAAITVALLLIVDYSIAVVRVKITIVKAGGMVVIVTIILLPILVPFVVIVVLVVVVVLPYVLSVMQYRSLVQY